MLHHNQEEGDSDVHLNGQYLEPSNLEEDNADPSFRNSNNSTVNDESSRSKKLSQAISNANNRLYYNRVVA